MQVYATCDINWANKLVCTVLTDLQTRFCWKLIYTYVIPWYMSKIIDLTKNRISNCNLRQHAFVCKYLFAHCFDWSTTYIMSIIVSNWQHCDEQQFRTLSCLHYTIFSVVKSDLFIRALLLLLGWRHKITLKPRFIDLKCQSLLHMCEFRNFENIIV